jgi:hypothetical protein
MEMKFFVDNRKYLNIRERFGGDRCGLEVT